MIDNYDDLNRDDTLAAVRNFDGEQLAEFIAFERDHKDRVTVIEPLERELLEVTSAGRSYVAGLWFDNVDDVHVVRRSRRVESAIDEGLLEIV
jgi:hypothetical protein